MLKCRRLSVRAGDIRKWRQLTRNWDRNKRNAKRLKLLLRVLPFMGLKYGKYPQGTKVNQSDGDGLLTKKFRTNTD